jgi:hypothetical protein
MESLKKLANLMMAAGLAVGTPSVSNAAKSALSGNSASKTYIETVSNLATKRPSGRETVNDVLTDQPGKPGELRDGDYYVQYEIRTYKAAKNLEEMVFSDNSDGIVYPGSLLWTIPLTEGRFVPLPFSAQRPTVNCIVAGGTAPNQSPTFTHNGTFLDFQSKADPFLKLVDRTAPRQVIEIGFGKSLGSALLNVGVSAKMWGARLDAELSESSLEQRSFAVLSLSEVYYTIVADTPSADGYFPPTMLDQDPILAQYVLRNLEEYGELGYVRSVKYGRRVIIAVSANASEEELKRSLKFSASGFGLEFKGSVDDLVRKTWESMQAKAVVIGGNPTDALADVVTGGPQKFLESVNRYLKDTAAFDAKTSPVPVSFEMRYVLDNEPMINYETLEFAGQIVRKRSRAEETLRLTKDVELTGADARLVHEDEEFDSDDWSKVDIRYSLVMAPDGRAVDLALTMTAYECEDDMRYNNETKIETAKSIRLFELDASDRRKILSVDAASKSDFKEQMFGGELHGYNGFASFGALRDIAVRFDGPDGNDLKQQGLQAKIDFVVNIDRER